ncbi:MAG: hypothetical protein U5J98_06980 [Halobacteriales archaeon]|nr:hypothetical protein [Halobacteriales archaeon]
MANGDDPTGFFRQFLNPNADSLFAKVDFSGIVGSIGGGTALTILGAFVAIGVALRQFIEQVGGGIQTALSDVLLAAGVGPFSLQQRATEAAAGSLEGFGFLAAPVSSATALSAVLVLGLVGALFIWGFD